MNFDVKKIRQLLLADANSAELALQLLKHRPDLKGLLKEEFAPVLNALQKKRLSSLTALIYKFRNGQKLDTKERLAILAYPELAKDLRCLDLANQRLSTFLPVLTHLSNLETLDLRVNKIHVFPESLRALKNLQQLYLDNNHLSFFPTVLLQLTQLKELQLGGNKIKALPADIGQLKNLRLLNLNKNNLRFLPDALTTLPRLTT